MAQKKVSTITLRLTEEEAKELEIFKKMVGKKTGSEALKYIIKEFPRWNKITKETFEEARRKEEKYNKLKTASSNLLLALQEIKNHLNEDR